MPNHPISMFIKGLLPHWYVLWANEQRNRIGQLEYNECTQQISRLEPASKAVFDHVNERMQAQFHHLEQQYMQQEQHEMQREQHNNQILVNNQQAGQTPQTPRIDEGPCTSLLIAHPAMPNVTNLPATPPNTAVVVDCFGNLDELPIPMFSTMNNGLPSTFVALLVQFQRNGLGWYVGLVASTGQTVRKMCYPRVLTFTDKSHWQPRSLAAEMAGTATPPLHSGWSLQQRPWIRSMWASRWIWP
jgi:hypothetical protein